MREQVVDQTLVLVHFAPTAILEASVDLVHRSRHPGFTLCVQDFFCGAVPVAYVGRLVGGEVAGDVNGVQADGASGCWRWYGG